MQWVALILGMVLSKSCVEYLRSCCGQATRWPFFRDSSRDICTRELHRPAEDREAFINGRSEPAEAVSEAAKQRINSDEWDIGDEDWPVSREVLLTFIASHSDANADGIAVSNAEDQMRYAQATPLP